MKKNRVKYSDVLIEAKKHLRTNGRETRKYEYLCHAINRAALITGESRKGNLLRRKIMKAINTGTVDWWLARQGISWSKLTKSAVQRYRHEWLDHLIKQYKEAEK